MTNPWQLLYMVVSKSITSRITIMPVYIPLYTQNSIQKLHYIHPHAASLDEYLKHCKVVTLF